MSRRAGLVAVLMVVVAAACSSSDVPKASKAFCRAADRYDSELERQQKKGEIDTARQLTRVEEIARTAPASIEDDAQLFLDAMRRVDDEPELKDDPDVRRAVDNVNRLANQACGVYDRGSGL